MALWVGGARLPETRAWRCQDLTGDSYFEIRRDESGDWKIMLHVFDSRGFPALRVTRKLIPFQPLIESESDVTLNVQPLPMSQPALPEAQAHDLIIALNAYNSRGEHVFDIAHDGMRTHVQFRFVALALH